MRKGININLNKFKKLCEIEIINESSYKPIFEDDFNDEEDDQIPSDSSDAEEVNPANVEIPEPVDSVEKSMESPENSIEIKQNNILKDITEFTKNIKDEIESLKSSFETLSASNAVLIKQVEEVREPSSEEKLLNMKNKSYPYYLGLNDAWKGAWFETKHADHTIDTTKNNPIKKMDDGSFAANYEDLPKFSKDEIEKSINIYE